jgi:hypothetical protein
MGGSSSIIDENIIPDNGKMYKRMDCGCIYSFKYENYGSRCVSKSRDIVWCMGCWDCLQYIREDNDYTYSDKANRAIASEIAENSIDSLVEDYGWMAEPKAIKFSRERRISVVELFQNDNYRVFNMGK